MSNFQRKIYVARCLEFNEMELSRVEIIYRYTGVAEGKHERRKHKRGSRSSTHNNSLESGTRLQHQTGRITALLNRKAAIAVFASSSWGSISGNGPNRSDFLYDAAYQPRARHRSVAPLADSELQNVTYVRIDLRMTFCVVLLDMLKLGSLFEGGNFPV